MAADSDSSDSYYSSEETFYKCSEDFSDTKSKLSHTDIQSNSQNVEGNSFLNHSGNSNSTYRSVFEKGTHVIEALKLSLSSALWKVKSVNSDLKFESACSEDVTNESVVSGVEGSNSELEDGLSFASDSSLRGGSSVDIGSNKGSRTKLTSGPGVKIVKTVRPITEKASCSRSNEVASQSTSRAVTVSSVAALPPQKSFTTVVFERNGDRASRAGSSTNISAATVLDVNGNPIVGGRVQAVSPSTSSSSSSSSTRAVGVISCSDGVSKSSARTPSKICESSDDENDSDVEMEEVNNSFSMTSLDDVIRSASKNATAIYSTCDRDTKSLQNSVSPQYKSLHSNTSDSDSVTMQNLQYDKRKGDNSKSRRKKSSAANKMKNKSKSEDCNNEDLKQLNQISNESKNTRAGSKTDKISSAPNDDSSFTVVPARSKKGKNSKRHNGRHAKSVSGSTGPQSDNLIGNNLDDLVKGKFNGTALPDLYNVRQEYSGSEFADDCLGSISTVSSSSASIDDWAYQYYVDSLSKNSSVSLESFLVSDALAISSDFDTANTQLPFDSICNNSNLKRHHDGDLGSRVDSLLPCRHLSDSVNSRLPGYCSDCGMLLACHRSGESFCDGSSAGDIPCLMTSGHRCGGAVLQRSSSRSSTGSGKTPIFLDTRFDFCSMNKRTDISFGFDDINCGQQYKVSRGSDLFMDSSVIAMRGSEDVSRRKSSNNSRRNTNRTLNNCEVGKSLVDNFNPGSTVVNQALPMGSCKINTSSENLVRHRYDDGIGLTFTVSSELNRSDYITSNSVNMDTNISTCDRNSSSSTSTGLYNSSQYPYQYLTNHLVTSTLSSTSTVSSTVDRTCRLDSTSSHPSQGVRGQVSVPSSSLRGSKQGTRADNNQGKPAARKGRQKPLKRSGGFNLREAQAYLFNGNQFSLSSK